MNLYLSKRLVSLRSQCAFLLRIPLALSLKRTCSFVHVWGCSQCRSSYLCSGRTTAWRQRNYKYLSGSRTCLDRKSNILRWTWVRCFASNGGAGMKNRNKTTVLYVAAVAVTVLGFSYAAVPLYRLYCQASGLGGTVKQVEAGEKIESMERKPERVLKIRFNADTSSTMQWHFKPQQTEVRLVPGETALAFYTATNPTDTPITGISTYNVIPFDAGQYFNKIQCFCFEEQRLNPHEQVDMPVFFYIDPEFTEDPAMAKVDIITLSYTFFEAKEAEKLGL